MVTVPVPVVGWMLELDCERVASWKENVALAFGVDVDKIKVSRNDAVVVVLLTD